MTHDDSSGGPTRDELDAELTRISAAESELLEHLTKHPPRYGISTVGFEDVIARMNAETERINRRLESQNENGVDTKDADKG